MMGTTDLVTKDCLFDNQVFEIPSFVFKFIWSATWMRTGMASRKTC